LNLEAHVVDGDDLARCLAVAGAVASAVAGAVAGSGNVVLAPKSLPPTGVTVLLEYFPALLNR